MINVKELRIGNWVNFDSVGNDVVETIDFNDEDPDKTDTYFTHVIDGSKPNETHPIQLTPEILEKCGFKPDSTMLSFQHPDPKNPQDEHKDLGTCYPTFFYNKRLGRWMDCHTRVCVDYLHQLQNLYYALTGEELTYNTTKP